MKVKIYTTPEFAQLQIIFYEERPDGKRYIAKPVDLIMKEYKEGEPIEPTIILPDFTSQEFMKQMAEEIKKQGIRTKLDEDNEGELKANKYHLEDLRKLLKLKN